jgi:hypothetical protein
MNLEVTYNYSPEFTKTVARQFLFHYIGWGYIFLIALSGIIGVTVSFALSSTYYLWMGGFLVAAFLIYTFQLIRYVQNAGIIANELSNQSVVVIKFNDENVTFQSEDHISIIKWKKFSQIWITRNAWLFFIYSNDRYTLIPSSVISKELRSFILSKINQSKVRNFG